MDALHRDIAPSSMHTGKAAAHNTHQGAPIEAPQLSKTHLVVIPTYNNGLKVVETVREARKYWSPVWVVVDGSTDGAAELLHAVAETESDIKVLTLQQNSGKGAAVLHALQAAATSGFTHALIMDADGQHPTYKIVEFMSASQAHPDAQILGAPVFGEDAPAVRVHGRKLSNFFANFETLW